MTITKSMCEDAVNEDRAHDLRIMRPTRYQLRYHRLSRIGSLKSDGDRLHFVLPKTSPKEARSCFAGVDFKKIPQDEQAHETIDGSIISLFGERKKATYGRQYAL